MSVLTSQVARHMVTPVHVVRETDSIAFVEQELSRLGISAVPVVDPGGYLVGVLSRTDLLRAGRVRLLNGHRRKVLTLPKLEARQLMTSTIEVVSARTPLPEAARCMIRRHIHRLFVSEDRRPDGVISTTEMMRAVIGARVETPISELARTPLVVVNPSDPLSLAIDRMVLAEHSGLVVAEDGWPVGVFSQVDALAARDAPPDDRVERWMETSIVCIPLATPAFRAAEQMLASGAHRLLAVDGREVRGILTGVDFARLVEAAHPGT